MCFIKIKNKDIKNYKNAIDITNAGKKDLVNFGLLNCVDSYSNAKVICISKMSNGLVNGLLLLYKEKLYKITKRSYNMFLFI